MTRELAPIDVSTMPDVARLAQEVARTGRPRVLTQGGTDLAVLSPARPNRRRLKGKTVTQEDIDAALSVAGAWKDWLDPEEFKRERRELQVHDRPDRQL